MRKISKHFSVKFVIVLIFAMLVPSIAEATSTSNNGRIVIHSINVFC